MKFTEEQYQKIIEIKDNYFPYSALKNRDNKSFIDFLSEYNTGIYWLVFNRDLENELEAIVNPLTREWAHDNFVEKEKKYVWQSKQETDGGKVKRLYDSAIGITDSFMEKTEPTHNGNLITETEVKKWGYNPDMFDNEEV